MKAPTTVSFHLHRFMLDCLAYSNVEKCYSSSLSFWKTFILLHRLANSSAVNWMCSKVVATCVMESAHLYVCLESSFEYCASIHWLADAISTDCKLIKTLSIFLKPMASEMSAPCYFCFHILTSWQLLLLLWLSYLILFWKARRYYNQFNFNCFIIKSYWQFIDAVFTAGLYIIQNNIISTGASLVVFHCHYSSIFIFRFETEYRFVLAA